MFGRLWFLGLLWFAHATDKAGKIRKKDSQLRHADLGEDEHDGTEHVDVPVVITPIFERRLYPLWGKGSDDDSLPAFVNDFSKGLRLKKPVSYLGKTYDTIYVLSNGGVTFDERILPWTSRVLETDQPTIAPWWVRNDLSAGGKVWFREELYHKPTLRRGESEIRFHFNENVKVRSVFLVTWEGMQPRLKRHRVLKRKNWNHVQLAILNTDGGTFANLVYHKIGWGRRAKAGFSDGKGKAWTLPQAGTTYPMVHGNTGVPGEWMFKVSEEGGVVRCRPGYSGDKCDERCGVGFWGHDCRELCNCGDRLCAKESARCLTEEEEEGEKIDWASIIGPINRRRRRFARFY